VTGVQTCALPILTNNDKIAFLMSLLMTDTVLVNNLISSIETSSNKYLTFSDIESAFPNSLQIIDARFSQLSLSQGYKDSLLSIARGYHLSSGLLYQPILQYNSGYPLSYELNCDQLNASFISSYANITTGDFNIYRNGVSSSYNIASQQIAMLRNTPSFAIRGRLHTANGGVFTIDDVARENGCLAGCNGAKVGCIEGCRARYDRPDIAGAVTSNFRLSCKNACFSGFLHCSENCNSVGDFGYFVAQGVSSLE